MLPDLLATLLSNTVYLTGPTKLKSAIGSWDDLSVVVPNEHVIAADVTPTPDDESLSLQVQTFHVTDAIVPVNRYSSLNKIINVTFQVLKFINLLKCKVNATRHTNRLVVDSEEELYTKAHANVTKAEQKREFPHVLEFFGKTTQTLKEVPILVSQLNLYVD